MSIYSNCDKCGKHVEFFQEGEHRCPTNTPSLRERCEKLAFESAGFDPKSRIRMIEDFAREIRTEALEEAAQICEDFNCSKLHPDARIRQCCAALDAASKQIRTYALAASGKDDK